MKLQAELNNERNEIVIKREGEKIFAKVDDREYELEGSQPEPNIFLLKMDNKIYEIFVSPKNNQDEPFKVKVKDIEFEIKIFDPKRLRGLSETSGSAEGIVEIKTAMPGKLVRILVEVGSEIKSGEGVLVVEAMKMQNEMKSPKDGIVKEIRFDEGATVNAGEILAIIE
jgi:biotin carboxyl carrier protein